MSSAAFDLENLSLSLKLPVLIVSTVVGRGMYTLGEAIQERFARGDRIEHVAIEHYLPGKAVNEDLERYKTISNTFPFLLRLVYKVPIFYWRKYLRERFGRGADLSALKTCIETLKPRTVVCISHRPAFWVSSLKHRAKMDFDLWGVLGEYGDTLGWRYLFWNEMNGFLSPLPRGELSYPFPEHLQFQQIELPARREYYRLREQPAPGRSVLLVCGYWGQGPIREVLRSLLTVDPSLQISVICGENESVREQLTWEFIAHPNVQAYGVVPSLLPFLEKCSCVVTKPGISTLLEAAVARRKIFLLKGMPVAEDNNARHAVGQFGAEWFNKERFAAWLKKSERMAA